MAGYPAMADDHSSRAAVADGLERLTREHGRAALNAPLFSLAPSGVYLASDVTARSGELLPHPFTLTRACTGGLLSVALSLGYPAGRYPAPCPTEPGLSSPRRRRSSWLLRPNPKQCYARSSTFSCSRLRINSTLFNVER